MGNGGGTGKERGVWDSLDDATLTIGPSSPAATSATRGSDGDAAGREERAAPAVFGRYRLEERIGAGGMGVVYRAYDPMLERPVALKIVRSRDGGEEGQRRLFREAQALAQVRHPNVVAVHDVGALGEEVFVAMEMVEGTPLSTWQKERDSSEILGAYLQAGRGLAAAHDRGLVHRDVKPGNILVGADGRVTVIDFGLAAAVDGHADVDSDDTPGPQRQASWAVSDDVSDGGIRSHSSLRAPLTRVGKVMGTPRYMSPEQHIGDRRVDALSDQYSFALALYEALAKTWPFVRKKASSDQRSKVDALRIAKERAVFATPVRAMSAHLRRTLQRALAANPGERFPSMAALLEQLAKNPARARKRQLAIAAVAASLAFGSWSVISGRDDASATLCQGAAAELAEIWNAQRRNAVKRAFLASDVHYASDTFERVTSALDAYGQSWTRMRTEACEATHVHGVQSAKVLDLRMGCLDRRRRGLQALVGVFTDKPDRQIIDKAVEASLGLGGLAFCADTKALEQEVEPPEKPEDRLLLAELRGQLEQVNQLDKVGKYQESDVLLQKLVPSVESLDFPPMQAELAFHAAVTLSHLGKYAKAEALLKEAIQLAVQWGMKDLAARAGAAATYLVGYTLQRHSEGLIYAIHAQGLSGGRGDAEAQLLMSLASVYYAQGQYERAEELHRQALAIWEKAFGPKHLNVAQSLNELAIVYNDQGKYAETEMLNKRALAIREKALGPEHPKVAQSLNNLAYLYRRQKRYREAEELHQRALAIREKALGPEHPTVAASLNNFAILYYAQEKYSEAEELHKRALAIRNKALGPGHPDAALSLHNLAACYDKQGNNAEAEELNKRAITILENALGPDHVHVAHALTGLAGTYEKQRRFAEALPLLERARQIREQAKVAPGERAEVAFALARILWGLRKNRPRARTLAQEALALYQTVGPGADKERLELEKWIEKHLQGGE